jgi:hypothetical protein
VGDETRTDFWGTIAGLLRRKAVIIPALLVALSLGALAYSGTPTSYVSSTTMVLTPTEYGGTESQDPEAPGSLTNPMLNFNDSLRTTAAILIEAMNTKGVADQLGVTGTTQLAVNDGRTNPDLLGLNGPFLYIVATSTSPSEAERVAKDAQQLMRQKLRQWQAALNAPQKTFVSITDVVSPATPEPDRGKATKLALMAFLFGFLLFLGIAYFVHQFRARRRARAAVLHAVGGAAGPQDGASRGRWLRRPTRSPVLDPEVAVESDEDDEDDDKDDEPAVVATTARTSEPTIFPTPFTKPVQRIPTRLQRKGEPFLRPVPMKQKVRSRNR